MDLSLSYSGQMMVQCRLRFRFGDNIYLSIKNITQNFEVYKKDIQTVHSRLVSCFTFWVTCFHKSNNLKII